MLSELRYKACPPRTPFGCASLGVLREGEVRYAAGSTPTKYTYTGQYSNVGDFGLMFYNARWYDPYLNRWTQPDSIVPDSNNPQAWDRYGYALNNPIRYNDPTGHRNCEEDGYNCPGDKIIDKPDKGDRLSSILNTVWNRYKLGWANFGSAWSVINNPNAPAIAKAYSGTYIFGWGGAHLALAAGLIAIGVDTSRDQQPAGYAPSEEGSRGPIKSPFGYPDLSQPPGDDWEWRTQNPDANPPGSNRGAWQSGDQQLHNDPYEKTYGPHVDYTDPDGNEWRIWPDGSMSPKYPK